MLCVTRLWRTQALVQLLLLLLALLIQIVGGVACSRQCTIHVKWHVERWCGRKLKLKLHETLKIYEIVWALSSLDFGDLPAYANIKLAVLVDEAAGLRVQPGCTPMRCKRRLRKPKVCKADVFTQSLRSQSGLRHFAMSWAWGQPLAILYSQAPSTCDQGR